MSCIIPNIIPEGATLTLNNSSLDTFTMETQVTGGEGDFKVNQLGAKDPYGYGLYLVSANIRRGKFDVISYTYKGFHDKSSMTTIGGKSKLPTGGATLGTIEQPIMTHPDYPTKLGAGKNPNQYGRRNDSNGMFSNFGPLPDGPANGRAVASQEDGADRLQGIESFLDGGAMAYSYSIVTERSIGPWDSIGKIVTPVSSMISVPTLLDGRNWLLVSFEESTEKIGGSLKAVTSTFKFQASGEGGWNPLIYRTAESTLSLPL